MCIRDSADTLTGRRINKDVLQIFNLCTEFGSVTHTDVVLVTIFAIIRCQSTIYTITQIVGGSSCLLYTSDAADDLLCVDLGGRRILKKKKRRRDRGVTYQTEAQ